MDAPLAFAILAVLLVIGLLLIPFGLPGLWLMVLAILGYAALGGFQRIGWATVLLVFCLAAAGEVAEAWLGFRLARRHGASSRAGWGALLGGFVGALVGTPVPIIGSVVGAFLGAFIGAVLFEHRRGADPRSSVRAGWGAVLGRAAGAALKIGLGLIVAIIGVGAALR